MQGPSAAILINEVDIFPSIDGKDEVGGYAPTYAATPTYQAVPCMVEADDMGEIVDDQQRITRLFIWYIMTDQRYNLRPRSKIIFVDDDGLAHTMFSEANRGEAERGGAYTIRAIERL